MSRQYRDLLWLFAVTDFRKRYVGSWLGFLWVVLKPLSLFAVIYAVVTNVLFRFAGQIPDYGALLLLNIVLFTFFAEGTNLAMRSLAGGGGLLSRTKMPSTILPVAAVLTVALSFVGNLGVALGFILVTGTAPKLSWLLAVPLVLLPIVAITTLFGLLLSASFVRYRDVSQVWPTVTRALFYTTVIFPIEFLPSGLQTLQSFNPVAPFVVGARVLLIDPSAPGWFDLDRSLLAELGPFLVTLVVVVLAFVVYRRVGRRVAEDV